MYSVDTGHFYSNHEKYLHDMNCKYRSEKNYLSNKIKIMKDVMLEYGYTKQDLNAIKNGNVSKVDIIPYTSRLIYKYFYWNSKINHKRQKAKESKDKLLKILKNKVSQNIKVKGKDHIRTLREDDLNDTNIISVFDSSLSRTIGLKQDELTDELLVVQVYYFDVFKDMSFFGFKYKDEKYKYFTSSAGQIRKKKAVFIKESTWNRIEKTIMCGLTIDKINLKGGNNVNKHLAYMALSNSATDEWNDFDIDRTIVVDDFETYVEGTFDFINELDYSITRKTDKAPIPHTDGAGMILPEISKKNFMFRSPWVKGLLGVFDFKRFIKVNNYSPIIKDIYGKEHDIFEEDIQIIFTKSQFKMYKYYNSWDEYKSYFKKYNCTAGRCNIEEDRIKNAKINYQMIQTLTDITDEEIDLLTKKSYEKLSNICKSKDSMMEILGVTPYNTNMTAFQKAIKIYPSLLSDTYAKDVIREVKNSLLKKYRSGKLEVFGKYTFLLPDFYAACEYWFGHIDNPKGLLDDGEVFCWLFKNNEKLDCLRSPHLYKEHAVRFNVAYKAYKPKSDTIREWFITHGIYTSTHDLISRILQFDVDGDKSLVVADSDFIKIAERNMKNIVPLYYNMKKAEPTELNNETIYNGLNAAFTGGNIGLYSNDISKIWNNEVFSIGTDEEKQEAIDAVKLLCMENNFVIDYAKTLYKPERPKEKNEIITKYTHSKLPAFFEYAKDKKKDQVENRNHSTVNKIFEKIPDMSINTRSSKLEKLDYKKMMSNVNVRYSNEIAELYNKLNSQYRYMINMKDEYIDNMRHVACQIRSEFSNLGYSEEMVADMLIDYLYGNNKRYKQLLWFTYGQYIVNNLEKNIEIPKTKFVQCTDCGEWFEVDSKSRRIRCDECTIIEKRRIEREKKKKQRMSH
uniref:RNA-dependent RNA polymerase n=1 Tax=Siphoviridae sp. ctr2f5 TaxID=2825684 RepID=A0A8S5QFR0_9CAUD|nr:MAG TPA: RNA-dependent RNA polymerase [Siphoviridae sp. ctr2f5]